MDADQLGVRVMRNSCDTCIFRKDCPLDLNKLLDEARDPRMEGFFTGPRICHHSDPENGAVCRGFWNRYKDCFTAGQVAQRLDAVILVEPTHWLNLPTGISKGGSMRIKVTQLSSGFVHVKGEGPCNWAQPPNWPCTEAELRRHAFPEASEDFIKSAMKAAGGQE